MKFSINNNYLLSNVENYKKKLDDKINDILSKYFEIIIEYLKYIFENINLKKNNYSKFIINRGIKTITHVFKYILLYTQNLDITYFHSQKSLYFYVEFIGQTSNEQNIFLQLSSRDATMYVYRKTIFEINNDYIKNKNYSNNETKEKFNTINNHIRILKTIIYNIINKYNFHENNIHIFLNLYKEIGYIIIFSNFKLEHLLFINIFIEKISIDKIDVYKYFEILNLFFKKITNNLSFVIDKINKLYDIEFNEVILSNPENIIKFINQ
jgi:hypothetical protein